MVDSREVVEEVLGPAAAFDEVGFFVEAGGRVKRSARGYAG